MANKKFSEFVLKTSTSDVSHIVGYNGAENVQITPANFVTTGGTGVFLPLAGGTMTGDTIHNDNVKSIYGTSGDGLQIYHDGSNNYIQDTGTGDLYLDASVNLFVRNQANGEVWIKATDSGVSLRYQDLQKLITTSTGISVTGDGLFTDDVNITQSTDVGVLNTTTLESGAAVGLSLTYPTSNVDAGDGLAISIGISGRGRSYIANSNLTNNLDASNLEFYTENGGVINKVLTLSQSKDATFDGSVTIKSNKVLTLNNVDNTNGFQLYNSGATGSTNSNLIFLSGAVGERMRLDSSGNLGLGITTFTNFATAKQLLVKGDALNTNSIIQAISNDSNSSLAMYSGASATDDPLLVFQNDLRFGSATDTGLGGYSEKMRLDASGNLGVGTSSPTDYYSGADNLVIKQASGAGGISIVTDSGSEGSLYFADGTTGDEEYRGGIAYNHNSEKLFLVSGGATKAVIDSSGNVGIGTSSPRADASTIGLTIGNTTIGGAQLVLRENTGNDFRIFNNGYLGFIDGTTERMRITSTGDLLVGATTGNAKLNVAGNINQKHIASVIMTGVFVNIIDLSANGNLDELASACRAKIYGSENSNVNVSYCEYYIVKTSTGFAIQQIGTRLDVGNTNAQIEAQISGNFLQVKNVANSSIGSARVVLSMFKG